MFYKFWINSAKNFIFVISYNFHPKSIQSIIFEGNFPCFLVSSHKFSPKVLHQKFHFRVNFSFFEIFQIHYFLFLILFLFFPFFNFFTSKKLFSLSSQIQFQIHQINKVYLRKYAFFSLSNLYDKERKILKFIQRKRKRKKCINTNEENSKEKWRFHFLFFFMYVSFLSLLFFVQGKCTKKFSLSFLRFFFSVSFLFLIFFFVLNYYDWWKFFCKLQFFF